MELFKKAGKGLGLSLVGRREGTGVFVSDMVTLSCRMLAPALGRHNFPLVFRYLEVLLSPPTRSAAGTRC